MRPPLSSVNVRHGEKPVNTSVDFLPDAQTPSESAFLHRMCTYAGVRATPCSVIHTSVIRYGTTKRVTLPRCIGITSRCTSIRSLSSGTYEIMPTHLPALGKSTKARNASSSASGSRLSKPSSTKTVSSSYGHLGLEGCFQVSFRFLIRSCWGLREMR